MTTNNDRRQAERYPVNANTRCPFGAPLVTDLGAIRIQNISMDGIGFVASKRVEPGAILAISLVNETKGFSRILLVHVAHVTVQAGGAFLVGGTLDQPLTYQELTALIM